MLENFSFHAWHSNSFICKYIVENLSGYSNVTEREKITNSYTNAVLLLIDYVRLTITVNKMVVYSKIVVNTIISIKKGGVSDERQGEFILPNNVISIKK